MGKENRSRNSRIESAIFRMEEYIEACKPTLLNSNKIVVEKEALLEYIEQLKKCMPEEIERYRQIISNREAIEQQARERAQTLIEQTELETNKMISENEIMYQARIKADSIVNLAIEQGQQIIDDAVAQGDAYKASAQQYLNDMLVNLHTIIYSCIDNTTKNTNKFLESLNQVGLTVQDNLDELNRKPEEPKQPQEPVDSVASIVEDPNGSSMF